MAVSPAQIAQQLLAERDRVIREIAAAFENQRAAADDESGRGIHLGEDGTETFDKELSVTIQADLQALLRDIDHALRKCDQGTYGICDDCGRPIAAERLEALPHAALCIACRQKAEHSRRVAHHQPAHAQA